MSFSGEAGGRRGARAAALGVLLALVLAAGSAAGAGDEASLYGVRLGMTRDEIAAVWLPLGDGSFAAPSAAVREIETRFDHEGRLYQLSFSVDVQRPEPAELVNEAFQGLVDRRWASSRQLVVSVSVGPGRHRVTIYDKAMRAAYVRHIGEQIAPLLKP